MEPRIINMEEKKLLGQHLPMSIVENKTGMLWSQFSPRIQDIHNRSTTDKISLQVYPADYFLQLIPTKEFTKWATVEVEDFNNIPEGLDQFILKEGLYAVFDYIGLSSDPTIYRYIYSEWLPNSAFELDNRPHFEVLGSKYANNDPNSEEEIWIPIKRK